MEALNSSQGLLNLSPKLLFASSGPVQSGTPGLNIWDSRGQALTDSNATVPFSFTYNGSPFNPQTWSLVNATEARWTYRDPTGVVQVQIQLMKMDDFGALKWVLDFTNVSPNVNSGLIANVNPGDIHLVSAAGMGGAQRYAVHYSAGSLDHSPQLSDFTSILNSPSPNGVVSLQSGNDGRSSTGVLPYFNVEVPGGGGGVIFAVGWSGHWASTFAIDQTGTNLGFKSGQASFASQLRPGESFRTPAIVMMPWTGGFYDGQNKFRQMMLKYFSPHDSNGALPKAVSAFGSGGGSLSAGAVAAQDLFDIINAVLPMHLSLNTFWQDAGWYPLLKREQDSAVYDQLTTGGDNLWLSGAGDWQPDLVRYPQGYGPVSAAAHQAGLLSSLWFEPERMSIPSPSLNSALASGKLLPTPSGIDPKLFSMVNFADEAVVNSMLTLIGNKISAAQLDIFRQDMNGPGPQPYWALNDTNKGSQLGLQRTGFTEAAYIKGLYTFWDGLRARFPKLLIDNCAAGGRRLDFEALTRSVALWRSDRVWEPMEQQNQMAGLSLWLPLQGRGADGDVSTLPGSLSYVDGLKYKIRSGYGWTSAYGLNWIALDAPTKAMLASETGALFGNTSPFADHLPFSQIFLGDFYPGPSRQIALGPNAYSLVGSMTSTSLFTADAQPDSKIWAGWQVDRPDLKKGIMQFFKRGPAAAATNNMTFRGLNPNANYLVKDLDQPGAIIASKSGNELMCQGLSVHCAGEACSKVYTYELGSGAATPNDGQAVVSAPVLWTLNGLNKTPAQNGFPVGVCGGDKRRIVTAADINGSGRPDIIFQNFDGSVGMWSVNAANQASVVVFPDTLLAVNVLNWRLVTAVDLNGDGHPDLIWQNEVDGSAGVWYMNGVNRVSVVMFPQALPAANLVDWRLVTAIDINADGLPDLVWQNKVDGSAGVWYMNGVKQLSSVMFPNALSNANLVDWRLVTAIDINADGHPDLVWQNKVDGAAGVWYMNGLNQLSPAMFPDALSTSGLANWHLLNAVDVNGDGHPDLIWQF